MKKIKQKYDASNFGGFSDSRVRFFIFGFMTAGIVMEAFLGIVTALVVVLIFGIFTAVKANEIQSSNRESMLRHSQQMDRLYHYSVNAEFYQRLLDYHEERRARQQPVEPKIVKTNVIKSKKMNRQNNQRLVLSHSV
jgi:uncharacterized membrane protein